MKSDLIPLLWDDGRIGSVSVDPQGNLRLHHAIDGGMQGEAEFAVCALKLQAAAPPYHVSPSVDATDASVLVREVIWQRD